MTTDPVFSPGNVEPRHSGFLTFVGTIEGRFSGVVDIPDSGTTLYLPTGAEVTP